VNFGFILPLALCAIVDLHVKLRRTTMVVKEHEEPLMQLVVLCKLGPSAPEVHLATPIIVHLHFIWSSASRMFVEDSFPKLAPIHELGELQRNTLLLTALSTSDAEERVDLGRRRRRRGGIARSSARAWSSSSRYLGLVFAPQGAARAPLCRCRRRSHQGEILWFVFTATRTAASPLLHQHTGV
jgi:hypothetical protein